MATDDDALPALTLVFCRPEGDEPDDEWTGTLLDLSVYAYEAIEAIDPRFSILKSFTFEAGSPYETLRMERDRLKAELDKVIPYLAAHNACGYSFGDRPPAQETRVTTASSTQKMIDPYDRKKTT